MSWDIWIVNSKIKIPYNEIDGTPLEDFGDLDSVVDKISAVVPNIDWRNKTYPHLDGEDYVGHIGLSNGENNICTSIMFHVYGGTNPTKIIAEVCKKNGWLALDISTEEYLDLNNPNNDSWNEFQDFRSEIIEKIGGKPEKLIKIRSKRWWEFWK